MWSVRAADHELFSGPVRIATVADQPRDDAAGDDDAEMSPRDPDADDIDPGPPDSGVDAGAGDDPGLDTDPGPDTDDDRWPHEPDEPDPEARWGNPEEELPTIPEVDVPDAGDADPEVRRAFWAAVVMANVALLLVSLGPMLAVFRGQWRLGGALFAVGVIVFYRLYRHYRSFAADDGGDDGTDDDAEDGSPTDEAEDNA